MKHINTAAVVLFLSLSIASALNFDNLDNYADFYNKKIESAPEVLKGMIGNENVSLTIFLNNGSTLRWGMMLENAKIVESGYGDLKDATIEVKAAQDAINDVLRAKDPIAAYREAEESGQMSLDGKTFGAGIKIKIALGMGSMINSFISSLRWVSGRKRNWPQLWTLPSAGARLSEADVRRMFSANPTPPDDPDFRSQPPEFSTMIILAALRRRECSPLRRLDLERHSFDLITLDW